MAEIKNEVYGEATIDLSVEVDSDNETMGMLEAGYKLDPDRIIYAELLIRTIDGQVIKVNVHNLEPNMIHFMDW
ncbi:hypothetical protein [Metabacillus fastidiosus]|uniref:hypothetical protein n=1 Tax=Metabacillus fastidiosus TaxID=1458 RepID=UPI003D2CB33D